MITQTYDGRTCFVALLAAGLTLSSCAMLPERFGGGKGAKDGRISELEVQSTAMEMADDYLSALGEATYISAADARRDPKARALSQSFLRNGVGAAIDIASGPNPNVALLDLMVLASLQSWSYEHHWLDAGIGKEAGAKSLARLQQAQEELWQSASRILSPEQRTTVQTLVDAWIAANQDRMVVSLVRFDDFTDERRTKEESHRKLAGNLIIDLNSATSSVDDARLLGERALWFSSRYPFVLGEQMELTMYRLADQPEAQQVLASLSSLEEAGKELRLQGDRMLEDIAEQRQVAFQQLSAERVAAIHQAEESLASLIRGATEQTFARIEGEKVALLSEFDSRQSELGSTLDNLSTVIADSTILARELNTTAETFDQILRRFEASPETAGEPLDMRDVRDAAVETARAAGELNTLLAQANAIMVSGDWESRLKGLDSVTSRRVDQLFWRGMVLVFILLVGLAGLRFIPPRRPNEQ